MDVLESSLKLFFEVEDNFLALKNILTNKNMQPRLIDYYVTQHAKNSPEFFFKDACLHDVYNSYKLMLKGYHKRNFNLFCKKKLITLTSAKHTLILPLAKINVYRWLISNKITDLLQEKHISIQKKYYDFRKLSIDKNKKRGKMSTFLKIPTLVNGLKNNFAEKRIKK